MTLWYRSESYLEIVDKPKPLPVVFVSGILSGIPDYGGPLQTTFEYLWSQWQYWVASTATEIAESVGEERLLARMSEDPRLQVLFAEALEAAGRTGFAAKRQLLGKVVAYAFLNGDEAVDPQVLMIQALAELEPVHIRAMLRLRRATDPRDETAIGEFNRTQPRPVLAVLERTGVIIPATSWVGTGLGAHDLSDFGRLVLDQLRSVAEEEMERLVEDA